MSWFSKSDLEAQVSTLSAENARLTADLAAAQSQTQTASELHQEIAELKGEVSDASTALRNEEAAHAVTKGTLLAAEAKLKPEGIAASIAAALEAPDAEASKPIVDAVQSEVSRQVAATGRAPLDATKPANTGTATAEGIQAELDAAPTPEARTLIFRKHKASLKTLKAS